MTEVGFSFWGLFLIFGLVVAGYVLWMLWIERGGRDRS